MKYWILILTFLLIIVLGAAWFVNREFQALTAVGKKEEPAHQQTPSWQFAVIGDTEGVHSVTRDLLDDMRERDLAFVAHVGDISATGDEAQMREVIELFSTLPFPTYFVPGNNDLVYNEQLEIRTPELYQAVVNDELYYAVDHESAHIVLLDNSYRRYGFADEELEWLENDLQKNVRPLTFLFFHRPLDVPGQQFVGDDETTNSRAQNEKLKTLLSQFSIDHIFNGHLHTSLSYTLNDIPVTVTGGGGALPQDFLGGKDAALFHYYIVNVYENGNESSYSIELVEL
jgi:predicted phosphodiesterase